MTPALRWMLTGLALLIIGVWGAALHEVGGFYSFLAIAAPIAGIVCIVISYLEAG